MPKLTQKAKRAYWIAAGLFLLPLVLVWVTLNASFGIGGNNPAGEAAFIYLITWPLQIPLVVIIVMEIRRKLKTK
jgi:hypothetical protein